jgi:hypothetical protein
MTSIINILDTPSRTYLHQSNAFRFVGSSERVYTSGDRRYYCDCTELLIAVVSASTLRCLLMCVSPRVWVMYCYVLVQGCDIYLCYGQQEMLCYPCKWCYWPELLLVHWLHFWSQRNVNHTSDTITLMTKSLNCTIQPIHCNSVHRICFNRCYLLQFPIVCSWLNVCHYILQMLRFTVHLVLICTQYQITHHILGANTVLCQVAGTHLICCLTRHIYINLTMSSQLHFTSKFNWIRLQEQIYSDTLHDQNYVDTCLSNI